MSQDFSTWPLFIILLLSACSMVVGRVYSKRAWYIVSKILIVVVCVGIVVSLYHDSTDVLNFYF